MTTINGFNQLQLSIDTEANTFHVTDSNFGTFKLTLPNLPAPIWYGAYESGKLAIYKADMEGEKLYPCYALVFIIAEQPEECMNTVGASIVPEEMMTATAVGILLSEIKNSLLAMAMEDKQGKMAHGNVTLH